MKKLLVILIIILFSLSIFAQDFNDKPVATVGNTTISSSEFLQRYEFTPLFRKNIKRMTEALKVEFLYSLIAEKLWALQAKDMGYDTSNVMKFVTNRFKKMFVRDELYHREIKNKVKVSEIDLLRAYHRYNTKLEVNFLATDSKEEIDKLNGLLKAGIPFDSVLAVRPEAAEQVNPEEIVFGQMDEAIEDSLYKLKMGQFSSPIFTPDGWYIFELKNKIVQAISGTQDEVTKAVKETMEARRELKLYREYYHKFFEGKKVSANAALLRSLSRKLSDILSFKKKHLKIKDEDPVYIDVNDVLKIEQEFGPDSLKMPLIEFEENPVSLKEYIEDLSFDGFTSKKVDLMSVASVLNAKIKTEIEHEFLARQGLKEGLDKLPQVQKDLEMWQENYLAQALQSKFIDSAKVSDKEVYNYYKRFNKDEQYPEEVNIVEVLTDSSQVIDKVLQALKNGEDIKELAKKYTQRAWTKKNDGEFGYFPVTKYGDIGKIAATMKVGDIYGPLKVPEGYSIFKLVGKREAKTELAQPFDKVKNDLRSELAYTKERKAISDYTAKLAHKFGIDINGPALRSINVTNLNAFGFRFLGFGGKITAAPMMMPNVDWVNDYIKSQSITP